MQAAAVNQPDSSVRDGLATAGPLSFAVVIPTYNHAKSVTGVLSRAAALGFLVVVVDDGSTDDTGRRLEEWQRTLGGSDGAARVEVVRHERNRGKAAALLTGFARAGELGATHAATIDSDGQLDPEDIPRLVEEARRHPRSLVLGTRPEHIEGRPGRCLVGRRYTSLGVMAQTGLRLSDTQCGLRVYPLELIRSVRCRGGRYAFEAEVIARGVWAGFGVREMPVNCRYFPVGERVSHWRPWRDSLRQGGVHARLLTAVMMPWGPRGAGDVAAADGAMDEARRDVDERSPAPRWRRLLRWINPARSYREVRDLSVGDIELASGLALGAMIGASPFYGLHTAMSVYTAWRLHLHPAVLVLGSQVSAPPLGVIVVASSMAVGHLLLTGAWPALDLSAVSGERMTIGGLLSGGARWLVYWLVGSVVVGMMVGAIAYFAGLGLARVIRRSRKGEPAAVSQLPRDSAASR